MAYEVAPIDVTGERKEKVIDPRSKKDKIENKAYKWWLAGNDQDLVTQLLSTTEFLKRTNSARIKNASIFSRLFSGKPLYNFLSASSSLDSSSQLPIGRPTANVCYSCTDTLVSRISQDKPKPTFLTDGGHYKERRLAKEANQFVQGELFRTKAYEKVPVILKDGCVLGNGFLKVYSKHDKVCIERTLETELLTDFNDGYYNDPRQLIQPKLVDRSMFMDLHPKAEAIIAKAFTGNVDSTPKSTETISDQIIVAEGWHLPSGPDANDGRHVIVCSEGVILDEPWKRDKFPFVKFAYNDNMVGFFAQGLIEILMPTQMEIYRMLIVASQAIELMGVPRIYIDELSKIVETSFNNRIGTIIKGRGPAPEFLNATANSPEIYEWIKWLIDNAFQMSGISAMSASGTKPAGLNSGESQRVFDGIQDSRFASLAARYQNIYTDLAYHIVDVAHEIAEETGKYTTVYPGKDGTREVDFKSISMLKDTFVIQCFEESSLPKDPAGRQSRLSEMLAAGEISMQEFRRLSNFPDLEQSDQLAVALEERILFCLDKIIDDGKKAWPKVTPDQWMLDPTSLGMTLSTNYINKYIVTDIEPEKIQCLRDWQVQYKNIQQMATPPPAPVPQGTQQAPPVAPPQASMSPTSGVQV
jgi:hypothetical protein